MERQRFLLDTNMLVGLIRNAPWARRTMSENGLNDPQTLLATSVNLSQKPRCLKNMQIADSWTNARKFSR